MPTTLTSVDDVEAAPDRGEIDVQSLDVVLNAPVVKWSDVPP